MLVTDIAYIRNNGKWIYLACCLDLFSNKIADWELSVVFDNLLVMKPAKQIVEKAKSTVPYPFAQQSGCTVLIGRFICSFFVSTNC